MSAAVTSFPEPSQRKLEANRANAQHSSGPKSAEGKLASSRNSLQHGLTGSFSVLPDEDAAEFERMQLALIDEHQPSTETESHLVEGMAQSRWLSQRALHFQDQCFLDDLDSKEVQKRLALFIRYGNTHDRQYSRCLNDLAKLRKDKGRLERGFDLQKREQAAELRRENAEIRRDRAEQRAEELLALKKERANRAKTGVKHDTSKL